MKSAAQASVNGGNNVGGFTIANFRSVAHGLQEGQFAVGERKQALGLHDLDPKYKRLLDEPVTMTLGLIGPDGRIGLTPMWFDYEGDKVLVNTASHRAKCEWIRKNQSQQPLPLGADKVHGGKGDARVGTRRRIRNQAARPYLDQVHRQAWPLCTSRSEDR